MPSQPHRCAVRARTRQRRVWAKAAMLAGLTAWGAASAGAQTYGIATMQPGTLNHTTGSAIA